MMVRRTIFICVFSFTLGAFLVGPVSAVEQPPDGSQLAPATPPAAVSPATESPPVATVSSQIDPGTLPADLVRLNPDSKPADLVIRNRKTITLRADVAVMNPQTAGQSLSATV